MKRIALRFPRWAKILFSTSLLLSLVTGIMWFYLGRWGEVQGEFGPEKHPWLGLLAKLHGAGAFVAMISFGIVLGGHVPVGWRTHLSRKSGIFTITVIALSILTAYGLYYSGSDDWRETLIITHFATGLLLPVAVGLHIRSAHKRHRH